MASYQNRLALAASVIVSMITVGTSAHAYTAIGTSFPAFGADAGPGYIITVNPGNTISISATGQGPYDGSDDTYIGVQNLTNGAVNSFTLTGNTDIFGFDGDGINTYGAPSNSSDNSGYGGPDVFFSSINGTATSGTVNFINGLGSGQQTYFSLEESLSGAAGGLSGGGVSGGGSGGVSTVPLPASFPMFGIALLSLVGFGYSMNRWVCPKGKATTAA